MKKIMWAAVALTLFAVTSRAQDVPKADVAVGYSYLHADNKLAGVSLNFNGFNGSADVNANSWLGIAGDFGYYHTSVVGVGLNAESYTFGPRIFYRKSDRAVPFFETLFGGAHLNQGGGNAFAYALGGGADVGISHSGKVGLRPEFDYVGLRQNGTTANTVRVSVGIVFHIGQK